MLENNMMKLVGREDGDEDRFRLWQSLSCLSQDKIA
jgi:phosphatidylinositol 3-kinase